jgi:hypothetical protein
VSKRPELFGRCQTGAGPLNPQTKRLFKAFGLIRTHFRSQVQCGVLCGVAAAWAGDVRICGSQRKVGRGQRRVYRQGSEKSPT